MSLEPKYFHILFKDIICFDDLDGKWDNADSFLKDWKSTFYYISDNTLITDVNIKLIWNLLYSRFANSPIANKDEDQFKNKVFAIIFQYAPTWQKELDIQKKLRGMNLDSGDLFLGTKMIYNHAYNPSTEPSTASLEELTKIDNQNTTHYKKGVLEGLNYLDDLLKNDVTEAFISKFKKLFKQFVTPDYFEEEE